MAARALVSPRLRGAAKTASSDRRLANSGSLPYRSDCTNSGLSTLITPPPAAPALLLAGDEMFISQDGKSHTIYRLEGIKSESFRNVVLEESYDIEKARKKMRLIGPVELTGINNTQDDKTPTAINEQADLFSFHLQEINNGIQKGAGTGSMTWESSVAMSLYFTENPHELKGNVLELGSGVGLGAIMVAKELSSNTDEVSVTCTDVNDEVLEMLEHNMEEAAKSSTSGLFENSKVQIQKLDWFDFVGNDDKTKYSSKRYDTIIASDCAYLPSQINPLSETISKLLGTDVGQKVHMFAPANRSVIYELTDELRGKKNMNVQVESIELSKKRVKSEARASNYTQEPKERPGGISRILHITAWHTNSADRTNNTYDEEKSMFDID